MNSQLNAKHTLAVLDSKSNFHHVTVLNCEYYFSYRTLIAFDTPSTGLIVSENVWSTTTGRHLNQVCPDKSSRLARQAFLDLAFETFGGLQ